MDSDPVEKSKDMTAIKVRIMVVSRGAAVAGTVIKNGYKVRFYGGNVLNLNPVFNTLKIFL